MELDTATLADKDAERVEALVANADFFGLPATIQSSTPQPDRFRYSLEVTREDGSKHAVASDEEAAPEPLLKLFHAVQSMARK